MGWLSNLLCISLTVRVNFIPLSTFPCVIFNILSVSACLGENFYTSLAVLIRLSNVGGSWKVDLSGLWYVSDITLSW